MHPLYRMTGPGHDSSMSRLFLFFLTSLLINGCSSQATSARAPVSTGELEGADTRWYCYPLRGDWACKKRTEAEISALEVARQTQRREKVDWTLAEPAEAAPARELSPPRSEPPEETLPDLPPYLQLAYRPTVPISMLDLPSDYWVVQLVAFKTQTKLNAFEKSKALPGVSGARVLSNGQPFFVVLLGVYPDYDTAKLASTQLPDSVATLSPYLRSMRSLQRAMIAADQL